MKVSRRDFFVTTAAGAAGVAAYGAESPPVTPPEALARYEWILRKWGSDLTDAQKVDLMRLIVDNERSLVAMRKFALDNGVMPGEVEVTK
jgi:hypothetical protein